MEDDSLFTQYINKLHETKLIGLTLTQFFSELFELQNYTKYIPMFSKLARLYPRDVIFFAICDAYDVPNVDLTNPYPLVVYFIKKRLSKFVVEDNILTTDNTVKEIERLKKKKPKFREIFDE